MVRILTLHISQAMIVLSIAFTVARAQEADKQPGNEPPSGCSTSTRIQGAARSVFEIPNCGVQLPRISPEGQAIACLQREEDAVPIDASALITGLGLQPLSLWRRALEPDATPRMVCPSGAAWPTWSADSRTRAFIACDAQGRCSLRLHDINPGRETHYC